MANKKKKKKAGKIIAVIIVLIILAVAAFAAYIINDVKNEIAGTNLSDDVQEISFVISSGDATAKIGSMLKENGIIKYPRVFVQTALKEGMDKKFQPGTYYIKPGSSYEDIFSAMQKPVLKDSIRITFPEGYSADEIVSLLVEKGLGQKDAYDNVILNGDFDYSYLPAKGTAHRLEGYLYPDTYDFFKDATEEAVIKKFLDNFNTKINENDIITKAENAGMTMNDIITLASIIEKEGQVEGELPIISSVFYNRLNINMKLQSCATVNYVLPEEDRKWILTYEDMATESPYNTYLHTGLTPTPIANPGIKSIIAALEPADTDYLYFCGKGDGSHAFSVTLEEHEANAKKYLSKNNSSSTSEKD